MENLIRIIHFKLIFNTIFRKLLNNFDWSRGAEPGAYCLEIGFLDRGMFETGFEKR